MDRVKIWKPIFLTVVMLVTMGMLFVFVGRLRGAGKDVSGTGVLRGKISSPDGKPLYGILIKAREDGKSYTTSVFSDDNGRYDFPPLPMGSYQVWVGAARKNQVDLTAAGGTQDFTVKLGPELFDQVSASKIWSKISANDDKKMEILQNCTNCHTAWRPVKWGPSTPEGWSALVDQMAGRPTPAMDPYALILNPEQKKDIAGFLSDTLAPDTIEKYAAEALDRPRGEAARAVYTEYDLPGAMSERVTPQPDSEFVPARENGHIGVWVDNKTGNIWYAINGLAMLDPKTGEVQQYPFGKGRGGYHDLFGDKDGNIWETTLGANKMLKFNMATHEYKSWDIPKENGQLPHTSDLDKNGNLWISMIGGENSGVVKLDPETGEQTRYAVPTKFAGVYSIEADKKKDTVWFTEITANKISKIEKDGKLTEYDAPKPHSMPRRMQLDSKGKVWFTESWFAKIAMLDPETTKITEYDYGIWGGFPYMIKVDKFDRIWFDDIQGNSLGMYDQGTKKFTVVPLPTPESFARDASFDYTTDPPSIVYSPADLPIIGRMYIRK